MNRISQTVNTAGQGMTRVNHSPVGRKVFFGTAGAVALLAAVAFAGGLLTHFHILHLYDGALAGKVLLGVSGGALVVEGLVLGFFGWSQRRVGSETEKVIERIKNSPGGSSFYITDDLLPMIRKALPYIDFSSEAATKEAVEEEAMGNPEACVATGFSPQYLLVTAGRDPDREAVVDFLGGASQRDSLGASGPSSSRGLDSKWEKLWRDIRFSAKEFWKKVY